MSETWTVADDFAGYTRVEYNGWKLLIDGGVDEAADFCRMANKRIAAHNGGTAEALRVLWALTVEVRSYAGGLEDLAHAHGADLSAGKALGERIDAWYEANRAALTPTETEKEQG